MREERSGCSWYAVIYTPTTSQYTSAIVGTRGVMHTIWKAAMKTELRISFLSLSEYEAMESYSAQSEDEVTFKTGDTIQVLSKSLDGWWKIKYVHITITEIY